MRHSLKTQDREDQSMVCGRTTRR